MKTFKVAINVDNLKSDHPIKDIADTLRCIADDLGREDMAGNIVAKESEQSKGEAVGRYGFYDNKEEVKIQTYPEMEKTINELFNVLGQIEFVKTDEYGFRCPYCDAEKDTGHDPNCRLKKLIRSDRYD